MNNVLQEDLEFISMLDIPWYKLKNASFLITGATGLIGSIIVKSLCYASNKYNLNLKVVALIRDLERATRLFNGLSVSYIIQDICTEINYEKEIDYIIHCAAVTKSKAMITNPIEVINTSLFGTLNILNICREKHIKSMVYLSSMEVYGVTNPELEQITENDLGYIDLTNIRSCYPESKRMCEQMCNCYSFQYNIPVKIARLAQTFGAGVSIEENRVFAQFAKSAMSSQNIILHTDGSSTGNYCYTSDAIKAIFLLLLKGENGQAYNISNEDTNMTIKQMANLVANEISKGKIKVLIDTANASSFGYSVPVHFKLSSEKIRCLGWKPQFNLKEMYIRTIAGFENK